jgi:hypothetical protein
VRERNPRLRLLRVSFRCYHLVEYLGQFMRSCVGNFLFSMLRTHQFSPFRSLQGSEEIGVVGCASLRCGNSTSSSSSISHSSFERRPRRRFVGYSTHGVLCATSSSTPAAPPHQALELLWLWSSTPAAPPHQRRVQLMAFFDR